MLDFYKEQIEAIKKMRNGCILCGSVGSGKSRTALGYYFKTQGGMINPYEPMKNPCDLYIITTAKKRDTKEWESEMTHFALSLYDGLNTVVDSWNNIKKYVGVKDAFFIFDEQRVVGYGAWTKSFLQITKQNKWILLSATPGDTWTDYIPVFIANGFFKNKTHFISDHVVYDPKVKFPKVLKYMNTTRLVRLRDQLLVDIPIARSTIQHHENMIVGYDSMLYKSLMKTRWDLMNMKPIENAGELCYALRKIVNSDHDRMHAVHEILEHRPKAIIFYNFDYELDILKASISDRTVAEWNGHKHEPIPKESRWAYLVQYTAGCEGWNCIDTDTIIFYSQNYSYRIMTQACGRIDRINTTYRDLYYYHLISQAPIDRAISKALTDKKTFNEGRFVGRLNK